MNLFFNKNLYLRLNGVERPVRSRSIVLGIWGTKVGRQTQPQGWAIQISAQQPRIDIDVLNLGSSGDLTIFRPMVSSQYPQIWRSAHRVVQ